MKSIWNEGVERKSFSPLNGSINTDVLIIGGGMCGILCAYMLKKEGVDCVLVEADKICRGITNDTTAKLTLQHGLIYNKIMNRYGTEKAFLYYQSQKKALEKLKEISSKMDTDLEDCNSFVYSLNNREIIEEEVMALNKLGCKAEFCEETELPFDVAGAVKIENQGKFHPLKFAYGIAENLKIFENTKVIELAPNVAITNRGNITARKIVVATHFPFLNKHGGYFIKMYQHRSYVLALENAGTVTDMYVDERKDGLSFRSHKDILLLGGGAHRTGGKGGGWAELERVRREFYPDSKEVARWATQDRSEEHTSELQSPS